MTHTVNVQNNLVAGRDVGRVPDSDGSVSGFRGRRQAALRARLAYFGDRDHFIFLHGVCDGWVGGAIADAKLLAGLDRESATAAAAKTATPAAGEGHTG